MHRRKILVAEDHEAIRSAVAYCLRRNGYTVLLSGDGSEALNLLREQEISLIILDLSLPHLDGFTILEHLRNEAKLNAVAAIVLTVFDDAERRRRGLELGAQRFIAKPFSLRELMVAVDEVMGARAAGEERRTLESPPSVPEKEASSARRKSRPSDPSKTVRSLRPAVGAALQPSGEGIIA